MRHANQPFRFMALATALAAVASHAQTSPPLTYVVTTNCHQVNVVRAHMKVVENNTSVTQNYNLTATNWLGVHDVYGDETQDLHWTSKFSTIVARDESIPFDFPMTLIGIQPGNEGIVQVKENVDMGVALVMIMGAPVLIPLYDAFENIQGFKPNSTNPTVNLARHRLWTNYMFQSGFKQRAKSLLDIGDELTSGEYNEIGG